MAQGLLGFYEIRSVSLSIRENKVILGLKDEKEIESLKEAEQSIHVENVGVKYMLHKDMSGILTTELTFYKNGYIITEEKCKGFYESHGQQIEY